ncbi:MAG: hypothetical protein ACOYB3_00505 [Azonexus sp.]
MRIGLLRTRCEPDTIIPCLLSVEDQLDKVVVIHGETDDVTRRLLLDYTQGKNQFVVREYLHPVKLPWAWYPGVDDYQNSLAALTQFGYDTCRSVAGESSGFVMLVDSDQIYMPWAFDVVEGYMRPGGRVGVSGGINGMVMDANYYVKEIPNNGDYARRNGFNFDHVAYCLSHLQNIVVTQERPYEQTNIKGPVRGEKVRMPKLDPLWFHFSRKDSRKTLEDCGTRMLPAEKDLYYEFVQPLFQMAGSPYANLQTGQ